jgi:Spy/CpxP family protein refolding chaperone
MTDPITSIGRIRTQGLLVLAATFLVGVLAGATGDRVFAPRRARPGFPGDRGPRRPGQLPSPLERLSLTPEQRAKIDSVFERTRPRTDSILRQAWPRLRAITDSADAQIRAVLTPEQREQFEKGGGFRARGGRFGRPRMPGDSGFGRRGGEPGRAGPPPP